MPYNPGMSADPGPAAGEAGRTIPRAVLFVGGGLFAALAVYLALRLPRYWDGLAAVSVAHTAGLAMALAGAVLSLLLAREPVLRAESETRRGQYLAMARWLAGALGLSLMLTCVWGQDAPRAFFRGVLVAFLALPLVLLALRTWCGWPEFWPRLQRSLDIVAVNLLVLLVAGEVCVRVVAALCPSPLLCAPHVKAARRIAAHKLRPGEDHLGFPANGLGYYDKEWRRAKRAGTVRVLGVADSFGVETVDYRHNFLTRLEKELSRHGPPTEVLNLSVDALSPRGYVLQLQEFFALYEADWALVCIFVGNDILFLPQSAPSLAPLRREFWYLGFVSQRVWTLLRSPAVQEMGLQALGEEDMATDEGVAEKALAPTFSAAAFDAIERRRLPVCTPAGRDKMVDARYAELESVLVEMVTVTSNRLFIAVIPDEFQVNDELWAHLTGAVEGTYDRVRPQREVAGMCDRLGIAHLDLLPVLRQEATRGPVYHPRDTHWNRRGHAVAARSLSKALRPILKQLKPVR